LVLSVQLTNQAVLAAVEQEVLHPEVVRRAISRAINELNAPTDTVVPRRTGLQAELTVLEQELARLTAAVAQGGGLKPLGGRKNRCSRAWWRHSLQGRVALGPRAGRPEAPHAERRPSS
jgi:hypothetical protein